MAAMFTGIIEKTSRVVAVTDGPMFRRLTVACDWTDIRLGDSVANNGACLTVCDIGQGTIAFDVIRETLDKTNLGFLAPGDEVHLERSLRAGDRFDGHFVQGHVDGTGELVQQVSNENEWRLRIRLPRHLSKYLAPKGSIAIDGVSLTIASVDGDEFEVALIPTTLQRTTLGNRPLGWRFNIECDIISKQIVYWLELRQGT
jgi:riboflavin synthase